ncbi:MAG: hypothetical protein RL215_2528 [Planctomycetota bacterium]
MVSGQRLQPSGLVPIVRKAGSTQRATANGCHDSLVPQNSKELPSFAFRVVRRGTASSQDADEVGFVMAVVAKADRAYGE